MYTLPASAVRPPDSLQMMTTYDVAEVLVVPHRTVLRLIREGTLKPTKTLPKNEHRFSREDLRRWIQDGAGHATESTASSMGVGGA